MALVRSQLYSPAFSTFTSSEYNRCQKVFLQNIFSLPQSFPIHVACFFLGVQDFYLFMFDARVSFIRRVAARGSLASLAAMSIDRDELLPLGLGWNFEFIQMLLEVMDIHELDLLDDIEVEEARNKLIGIVQLRRIQGFRDSAAAFVLDLFPDATIPREFSAFLRSLPYEAVRILLIFFANMFQFTYFRASNRVCPFCPGNVSSEHFFLCPSTPPPYNDWGSTVSAFRAGDFWEGVDRIFLTLQRWATVDRNFAPGFGRKIDYYFTFTQSQVVRRNTELLALQMRLQSI
jgi:hypothetical protein